MSYLRYSNQGATRNRELSPDLAKRLAYLEQLGVQAEIFSGGQPGIDEGGARVGSTRHDHGNAADVFFHKDGRKLDWANEQDRPIFEQIVREGKANGITGFGAGPGYMQAGSMHIGMGNPGVWGAGGKGENAPDWLRSAYNGSPTQPRVRDNPMVLDEVLAAGPKATPTPSSTPLNVASVEPPKEPSALSKGLTKFGNDLGFEGTGKDATFMGLKLDGDDGLIGDLAGIAKAFGDSDSASVPTIKASLNPSTIQVQQTVTPTSVTTLRKRRRGGLAGFGGMYV